MAERSRAAHLKRARSRGRFEDCLEPRIFPFGRAGDAGTRGPYEDPDYYDKTYRARRKDVEFYVEQALRFGGPVLEYGIGSGRIALPLAYAGLEVFGVDHSRPMLRKLSERLATEMPEVARRIRARAGDMRTLSLDARFPLVIAPFNAVLHLYERKEMEAFLLRVREHLAPGGWFIFDFSVPRVEDLRVRPDRYYRAPRIRHPRTGTLTEYAERFDYDRLRQVLLCEMRFTETTTGTSREVPLTHRQFFPQEMALLLHYNGFVEQHWSPDFSDRPVDQEVDSLVIRTRPEPGGRRRVASGKKGPIPSKRRPLARGGRRP